MSLDNIPPLDTLAAVEAIFPGATLVRRRTPAEHAANWETMRVEQLRVNPLMPTMHFASRDVRWARRMHRRVLVPSVVPSVTPPRVTRPSGCAAVQLLLDTPQTTQQ